MDENEKFVFFGTPLKELEDDELIPSKRQQLEDGTVRDEKGRRRFHGAFTGGFSAGFFNTVGSKEGFQPKQFVSSRSAKSVAAAETSRFQQSVEDFMDDEDRGEFGIAPQRVHVKSDFDDFTERRKRRKSPPGSQPRGPIPGSPTLKEIFKPEISSIGIRLLKQMGWKPGQGVGPRISKKEKRHRSTIYGCSLPPGVGVKSGDAPSSDDDESEGEESSVLFAPDDIPEISYEPKDNMHGIGYTGMDTRSILGSKMSDDVTATEAKVGQRRLRIAGQAFGVGAFEEDDDDIYAKEDMSQYDFSLDSTGVPDWRGGSRGKPGGDFNSRRALTAKKTNSSLLTGIEKVLEGFHLAKEPPPPLMFYPPPPIPPNFDGIHRWPEDMEADDQKLKKASEQAKKSLFAPVKHIGSVFTLLTPEAKARIEAAKAGLLNEDSNLLKDNTPTASSSVELPTEANTTTGRTEVAESGLKTDPKAALMAKFTSLSQKFQSSRSQNVEEEEVKSNSMDTSSASSEVEPSATSSDVKPFSRNPDKQRRFERYLEFVEMGTPELLSSIQPTIMTEWEKTHELSEFRRFAAIVKPTAALASRFVSSTVEGVSSGKGGLVSDTNSLLVVSLPADQATDREERQKAGEMGMFGKLTHEEFEWHPDSLLCKRFNVPNPFPNSDIVGVPNVEHDARNIFKFLNDPMAQAKPDSRKATDSSEKSKYVSADTPSSRGGSLIGANDAHDVDALRQHSSADPVPQASNTDSTKIGSLQEMDVDASNEGVAAPSVAPETGVGGLDAVTSAMLSRPPINFFKAIFSDSSSSENEEETSKSDKSAALPKTVETSEESSLPATDAKASSSKISEESPANNSRTSSDNKGKFEDSRGALSVSKEVSEKGLLEDDKFKRGSARGLFANLDLDAVNRRPEHRAVVPVPAAGTSDKDSVSSSSSKVKDSKSSKAFQVALPPRLPSERSSSSSRHKEKRHKKKDKHKNKNKKKKKKESKKASKRAKHKKKSSKNSASSESDDEWTSDDGGSSSPDSSADEERRTNEALLHRIKELRKSSR